MLGSARDCRWQVASTAQHLLLLGHSLYSCTSRGGFFLEERASAQDTLLRMMNEKLLKNHTLSRSVLACTNEKLRNHGIIRVPFRHSRSLRSFFKHRGEVIAVIIKGLEKT
jgi:hypothetical protein